MTISYFGEVADNMSASLINFTQDVEKERFNVKVQGFVIEKKFSNQTQILGINFVLFPICFVNGKRAFAVDLFAWRLPKRAFTLIE